MYDKTSEVFYSICDTYPMFVILPKNYTSLSVYNVRVQNGMTENYIRVDTKKIPVGDFDIMYAFCKDAKRMAYIDNMFMEILEQMLSYSGKHKTFTRILFEYGVTDMYNALNS